MLRGNCSRGIHALSLWQVHYRHIWNRYDDLMLLLFTLTFICWGASAADVANNDELSLERPLWSQYDPHIIGELVFAVANLLAIIRLLFFFQITQAIGPLQAQFDQSAHCFPTCVSLDII